MVPLPRAGHVNAAVENGLRAVERGLIDERLEVALDGDAVVRTLHLPDVDRFRIICPKLCGDSARPFQLRNPAAVTRAMTFCFVHPPVARSSNAH